MDNKEMICSMVCCRQEATHHQHDVLAELPRLKTSEADVEGLGRNIFAAVILQPVIKFPVEPVEVEGVLDERHEACDWCVRLNCQVSMLPNVGHGKTLGNNA